MTKIIYCAKCGIVVNKIPKVCICGSEEFKVKNVPE